MQAYELLNGVLELCHPLVSCGEPANWMSMQLWSTLQKQQQLALSLTLGNDLSIAVIPAICSRLQEEAIRSSAK